MLPSFGYLPHISCQFRMWGYFMKHNQTRQYIHQGCCRGVGISYKRIKGENDAT